jgi:hypothetical protein
MSSTTFGQHFHGLAIYENSSVTIFDQVIVNFSILQYQNSIRIIMKFTLI